MEDHSTYVGLLRKVLSIACHFAGDHSKEVVSLLNSDVLKKEVTFTRTCSKGNKWRQSHLILSTNGCDKAALFPLYVTKVHESVAGFKVSCFYLQVEARTGHFKNQPVGKNYLPDIFKFIALYHGNTLLPILCMVVVQDQLQQWLIMEHQCP